MLKMKDQCGVIRRAINSMEKDITENMKLVEDNNGFHNEQKI